MKTKEKVLVGIDRAPEALTRVCSGDKFGKMGLKVNEQQEMSQFPRHRGTCRGL